MNRILATAFALALVATGATVAAVSPPLPSFTVSDTSGRAVAATQIGRPGTWVLLVVPAAPDAARPVLENLALEEGGWSDALVIVAMGGTEECRALPTAHPGIAGAKWYCASTTILESLGLRVLPAALGVGKNRQVEWRTSALPSRKEALQSLFASWMAHVD